MTLWARKRATGWACRRPAADWLPRLAEMVATGEVSEAKALEMAHAYLHDTAVSLYPGKVH